MRVALTFDDGVSPWTEPILDLLAAAGAKATFFVCGHTAAAYGNVLRRIQDEGHEIGNHTLTHPRLPELSDDEVTYELRMCSQAIYYETASVPKLWRAPFFDHDARIDDLARQAGLTHVGCTVDPADWGCDSADQIAMRVAQVWEDGAIVDLHDGVPLGGGSGTKSRQPTVDAVGQLLLLTDVEFVTVTDL